MTIEAIPTSPLVAEMEYARAVSTAAMLPDAYRGKPADIMLAVGLGQSMGLSPAESLYRISVIKGKPTASAELIAANVRKAGHKLRVLTDETAKSVTATIFRADDPDFAFEVTRDMAWAQGMGLAGNDNYKKQPLTMLQWRAITAVARLACPEALYGVAYTADEIVDDSPKTAAPSGSVDRMRAALRPEVHVQQVETPAEAVGAAQDAVEGAGAEGSAPATPEPISDAQQRKMGALMRELGITERDNALLYVADTIGRQVESRKELSKDEASRVIDSLENDKAS